MVVTKMWASMYVVNEKCLSYKILLTSKTGQWNILTNCVFSLLRPVGIKLYKGFCSSITQRASQLIYFASSYYAACLKGHSYWLYCPKQSAFLSPSATKSQSQGRRASNSRKTFLNNVSRHGFMGTTVWSRGFGEWQVEALKCCVYCSFPLQLANCASSSITHHIRSINLVHFVELLTEALILTFAYTLPSSV
jgi:hypothetical protein